VFFFLWFRYSISYSWNLLASTQISVFLWRLFRLLSFKENSRFTPPQRMFGFLCIGIITAVVTKIAKSFKSAERDLAPRVKRRTTPLVNTAVDGTRSLKSYRISSEQRCGTSSTQITRVLPMPYK